MSASGGSTSDQNISTNKVVDGQSHYLAYITPDEGKSLVDQGGKETITDSGIPAYPGGAGTGGYDDSGGWDMDDTGGADYSSEPTAGTGSTSDSDSNQGSDQGHTRFEPDSGYYGETSDNTVSADDLHLSIHGEHSDGSAADIEEINAATANVRGATYNNKEDSLISQFKSGAIDKSTAVKNAIKLGLHGSKKLADLLGITTVFDAAMALGSGSQKKAMTWSLENRIKKITNNKVIKSGAYKDSDKIADLQADLQGIKDGTFTQTDFTAKYGSGDASNPLDASYNPATAEDDTRALTNIITPYAAHAVGGTTQQPSQAAQWYANLGSGNTNPGAFDLTAQYAQAKSAVSQRLQNTSSVGQVAVSNSAFFDFLKDNSLNKGIL